MDIPHRHVIYRAHYTHFTPPIVTASTVTVTMPDPPYKDPNGSTGKSHQLSTTNTSNRPTNKRTNEQTTTSPTTQQ